VNCAWCGKVVPVAQKGPIPIYCGRAHAQLAYSRRRTERLYAEISDSVAGLEAAKAETESLIRVLTFYADPSNYAGASRNPSRSAIDRDGGRRAAEALKRVRRQ
jgi:hypothetical protein